MKSTMTYSELIPCFRKRFARKKYGCRFHWYKTFYVSFKRRDNVNWCLLILVGIAHTYHWNEHDKSSICLWHISCRVISINIPTGCRCYTWRRHNSRSWHQRNLCCLATEELRAKNRGLRIFQQSRRANVHKTVCRCPRFEGGIRSNENYPRRTPEDG